MENFWDYYIISIDCEIANKKIVKQLKITYENTYIKQMIDETARMIEDRYYYPAIFTYEDGQEISVLFPDFDVATSGVDEKDAFLSAR